MMTQAICKSLAEAVRHGAAARVQQLVVACVASSRLMLLHRCASVQTVRPVVFTGASAEQLA